MAIEAIVWLATVALMAGVVQSTVGFGFGIVFLALAGLLVDVKMASMVSAFVSVVLNGKLLLNLHRHINWQRLRPILISVVIATPFGVLFLQKISSDWFNLFLGLLILWALQQQFYPAQADKRPSNTLVGIPMGIVSGLFAGAYNTGGPPLVVYVQSQGLERLEKVASLQLLLLVGSLVRVEEMWRQDVLIPGLLWPIVICCVATIIGSAIGLRLLDRISDVWFKRIMGVFLLLLAIYYMGQWLGLGA
ncbi:sulfite exporter TauE/SafE family protein [Pseudoteredinibacter isoporae]|uniref:sulfite exporter TauE/SafE family protein n=1 Tax=Pseudoteredinibacter isoporae TaxID=570281 RepID=UPI0031078DD4